MLEAEITPGGDVVVEGQHVGVLQGFRFTPDPQAEGEAQRTLNAAAQKALAAEIEGRAKRIGDAVDEAFTLSHDGTVRWLGEVVGKLSPGEHVLKPLVRVLSDEQLTGAALETVQRRLDLWIAQHVRKLLGPVLDIEAGEGLEGLARGIAFQVGESLGVLERGRVANEMRELDQSARGSLRKLGVRFGAYHIYLPQLLKPAPRTLAAQLWSLKSDHADIAGALEEVAHLASSGRTSFAANAEIPQELYLSAGFRVCGPRAVRVDILERLADLIRPAVAYRPGQSTGEPPAGTADRDGFIVTVAMTSLAGCSGEDFSAILRSLGYVLDRRTGPAITVPLIAAAPTAPIAVKKTGDVATADALEVAGAEQAAETQASDAPATDAQASDAQAIDAQVTPASGEQAGEASSVSSADSGGAESPPEPEPEVAVAEAAAPDAGEGIMPVVAEAPANEAPQGEAVPQGQDIPAGDTGPETEAQQGEPAESVEELIEVWRPRRHGQRPERSGARSPQRGRRDNRRQGEPAGQGNAAPAEAGTAAEGEQKVRSGAERFHRRRPDGQNQKSGERKFEDRKGREGQQRPQGDRRDDRKEGRPRHPGKRRDERQGGGARTFTSEPSRGRNNQPDPNSPFAKLLALKEQLESKGDKE